MYLSTFFYVNMSKEFLHLFDNMNHGQVSMLEVTEVTAAKNV